MAARDDLGARRAGRPRARRSSSARTTSTRSRRCCACATRRAFPSPRPRAAAACAARACRRSAACCSTSPRSRASSASTPTSMLVDVRPGTFGDVFEDDAARRARRHVRPLAAVDGAVDRRRLARVPRRGPALDPLRQDRGHRRGPRRRARRRHARPHRRRAARRGRSRSHAAVRRLRGHARHHRRRPAARPPAARRPRCAARTRSRRSPTGSTRCARIVQRGATPAVLRLYDAIEADRSYQTGDVHVLLVFDEGDAHLVEATRRIVDEECARADATRSTSTLVGRWFEHRNDVSALEALISRGFVVDTMEIAASWRALPEVYARRDRGDPRRRAHDGRVGAPESLVPRRRVPVLHVRRAAARRRARGVLPRPRGTPVSARCSRPVARSSHTTASGSTGPLRARCARRGLRRAAVGEGRARSERHPQPRQARPAQPVRRRSDGRDGARPRRRRRHEQRPRGRLRRRRQRRRTSVEQELLPDSPADGLVEFDARAHGRRVRRARHGRDRTGRPRRRRRHLRTSAARPSCGTARPGSRSGPGIGWQDLRTVGACLALRGDGLRVGPNQSATKLQWLLDQLPERGRAPRPLLRHRRHVGGVDAVARRGARHGRDQRRRHRAPGARRPVGVGRARARAARHPGRDAAEDRRLVRDRRRSARAAGRAADRRARSATSRRRSSARVACGRGDAKITFGTGGMLDLVLGDAPPVVRPARQGGHVPDRRVAARRPRHVGHRGGDARGGHQRAVAARRPRASSRAPTSRTSSRRAAPTRGGVVYVPAPLGLGTPAWDYGARGALFGLTRGTGRAEIVRAVLEGIAQRGADLVDAAEADSGIEIPARARRRRHDRQPDVRPGARRRRPDARSRSRPCARRRRAARRSWPRSRSAITTAVDDLAATWVPTRAGRARPARSTASAGATRSDARAGWIPELSGIDF